MGGIAEANRAARDAGSGASQSPHGGGHGPIRRHPVRGAVAGIELTPVNLRSADEFERDVAAFARSGNGSLLVTTGSGGAFRRDLIIALASRHKLPAVYPFRYYVVDGGLISYGSDTEDPVRRAAGYVDRILKGEKPADLPVQAPTKYELVINLKTAKALGLDVPATLLARADEVVE
jgi:putative tryptophan/tyrosine transport system substrate-binding protein